MRTTLEVADIFREHGAVYREEHRTALLPEQSRVMRAIEVCRTAALGGHVDACLDCGHQRISYNSCRNRHCPKCQALASAIWLEEREAELLPVPYFHVVFTLPQELAPLALQNKRVIYNQLFSAVWATLQRIARDERHLGAEIGCLAVLHTWGQQLQHHPHIHCVVPGGGLSLDGKQWRSCRENYFLPVKVLSRLFRRMMLERVERAFEQDSLSFHGKLSYLGKKGAFFELTSRLRRKEWVVYAKVPFGSPEQVLRYLGRYTHRVAISNSRLIKVEDGMVSFRWKDYRRAERQRVMTLEAGEFIRRFLLHVLPRGFQRIRHYGMLSNRGGAEKLERARRLLTSREKAELKPVAGGEESCEEVENKSLRVCPACGSPRWRQREVLEPAGRDEMLRLDSS